MEQYLSNVQIVMNFLKSNNYSNSVISAHRICYREFQDYLLTKGENYSPQLVDQWLFENQQAWNYRDSAQRKHFMNQLDDIYHQGFILEKHLGPRGSVYQQLHPEFRHLTDLFLDEHPMEANDSVYRLAISRFLYYLQGKGITDISQLNYSMVFSFHSEDRHGSRKSKNDYECAIRRFLYDCANKGLCSYGFSFTLNYQLIPQIVILDDKANENCTSTGIGVDDIDSFISGLRSSGYSKSVLKTSRHTLTLLYIFLDMHSLSFSKDNVWLWFSLAKPRLGKGLAQHRRTLLQFLAFMEDGAIPLTITGNPEKRIGLDKLPDWYRSKLVGYLDLLRREGRERSTIDMQRSSNVRFLNYLSSLGITSFKDITPEHLRLFNSLDQHQTPEGKSAYNSRIRGFLVYLNEQKIIEKPHLDKALPIMSAPFEKIVRVLEDEEINKLLSVDTFTLSSIEFRDYTIVLIGLTMGFRASDILSIRYEDINWKTGSIRIIQKKTGKLIEMPMPVHIGNTLYLYLLKHRPSSPCPYIFIYHRAPFLEATKTICRSALKRFIPERKDGKEGFHILRKTFATSLLKGNTKLELISDSLGHFDNETVHDYLSLDKERMVLCPLSLEETGLLMEGDLYA